MQPLGHNSHQPDDQTTFAARSAMRAWWRSVGWLYLSRAARAGRGINGEAAEVPIEADRTQAM
jgi:hypothetical protein